MVVVGGARTIEQQVRAAAGVVRQITVDRVVGLDLDGGWGREREPIEVDVVGLELATDDLAACRQDLRGRVVRLDCLGDGLLEEAHRRAAIAVGQVVVVALLGGAFDDSVATLDEHADRRLTEARIPALDEAGRAAAVTDGGVVVVAVFGRLDDAVTAALHLAHRGLALVAVPGCLGRALRAAAITVGGVAVVALLEHSEHSVAAAGRRRGDREVVGPHLRGVVPVDREVVGTRRQIDVAERFGRADTGGVGAAVVADDVDDLAGDRARHRHQADAAVEAGVLAQDDQHVRDRGGRELPDVVVTAARDVAIACVLGEVVHRRGGVTHAGSDHVGAHRHQRQRRRRGARAHADLDGAGRAAAVTGDEVAVVARLVRVDHAVAAL